MKKLNINIVPMANLLALILTAQLVGCASTGKSVALGGAVGAGAGAIVGGMANPGKDGEFRTRNVIIGSALGGLVGMGTGALIQNSVDNKKQSAYEQGKRDAASSQKNTGNMPTLQNPKVEARWMEGKIIGNRFVDGHFEYVIIEPARWEERN